MPLHLVRAARNDQLWTTCTDRFLDQAAAGTGPAGHPAWIWLSHRQLRDLLFEEAGARRLPGWLRPPVTLFADLPRLFDLREKPAGLLTRRRLLSRLAAELGREILGRSVGTATDGLVRAHMLDGLFADLLPEGVSPEELERALGGLAGDVFTERRNRWVVAVYRRYLESLAERDLRDWRSVRALLIERIRKGELADALGGAGTLHIYGLTNPRTFRRMLRALAEQREVEVHLYLPAEPEEDELEALAARAETVGGEPAAAPSVQPAPDAAREMEWVARRVKRLLVEEAVEPHRVAVVARTGREDTRRAFRALARAGVPCSARIRSRLSEIAALQALLHLFRGAARDWNYSCLRTVLDHPYFDTGVDLRSVDFLASDRRIRGLASWEDRLDGLRALVEEEDRSTWGAGLFADRVEKDLEAFRAARATLEPLSEARTEKSWIRLTQRLLREDRGVFFFRRRLCDAADDRWEVVRQDQRGVVQLERLLAEWLELDSSEEELSPEEWHRILSRMLEAHELVLSTPLQKGVQVLEAQDAASVPFQHTFLVHANDGEFPRAARQTGVLTDEERARLFESGVPVAHRAEALRRERRLWRAVTQQAGTVQVSYRSTDPAGTPLLPSLLVPEHDPSDELPRSRRPREEKRPVSPPEADRLAAHRLHQALGKERLRAVTVAPARPDRLRHAVLTAVAEWHRGPGRERTADRDTHISLRPNPWNGHWRDPALLAWLEEKFDADYPWSAGQLEKYGGAPFLFLTERVLELEEISEAEEETSPLAFGSIAHEILERFYRGLGEGLPRRLDEETATHLERTVEAVCAEREKEGEWLGLPAVWKATREQVRRKVRDYVEWELPFMAGRGEAPCEVELQFGRDAPAHLQGTDVHGRRARIRVRGRIDRLDRTGSAGDAVYHVLDYKSSAYPTLKNHLNGSVLQGALYLRVLEDQGRPMGSARYRAIKKCKNGCIVKVGSKYYEAAIPLALAMPARIRAGRFEPVAAYKEGWQPWDPGLEVRRNDGWVPAGTRFDGEGPEGEGSRG